MGGMTEKPPIGIIPFELWLEQTEISVSATQLRINELSAAINRYKEAGLRPSIVWIDELEDLTEVLEFMCKTGLK